MLVSKVVDLFKTHLFGRRHFSVKTRPVRDIRDFRDFWPILAESFWAKIRVFREFGRRTKSGTALPGLQKQFFWAIWGVFRSGGIFPP